MILGGHMPAAVGVGCSPGRAEPHAALSSRVSGTGWAAHRGEPETRALCPGPVAGSTQVVGAEREQGSAEAEAASHPVPGRVTAELGTSQ
jgi:hypothetical protein